jgi:transposase
VGGRPRCNDPVHADLLQAVEWLVAENRRQATQIETQAAQIRTLTETVEAQSRTIEQQAKRIAALEERLGRNSRNSSRPPSSDSPYEKPERTRKPGGRKQGGQPGHPGSQRALLDTSEVDDVVPHFPENCGGCGHALPEVPDGDPLREQIWELPPIRPIVTEHQFHGVVCPACAARTMATRGADLPPGAFGPRAEAAVLYLVGAGRLSMRETKRVFADLFSFPISTGGICRILARGSGALAPSYDEALDAVRSAPLVQADETPWYLRGVLCWLWLAATEWLRVFRVDPRRTIEARTRFLGEMLLCVLVTDRFVAYAEQPAERHQFCLAHLDRDGKALIALGGAAKTFGERFRELIATAFKEYAEFQQVHHDRALMRDRLRPTWEAMVELLVEGAGGEHDRVANFCAHLIQKAESMWTFTEVPGCPPDNNLAERSLRKPVQWRKVSLGSQSEDGCRFVERILTAVESLRAQQRDVLAFLLETMGAAAQGRRPPSLLPAPP